MLRIKSGFQETVTRRHDRRSYTEGTVVIGVTSETGTLRRNALWGGIMRLFTYERDKEVTIARDAHISATVSEHRRRSLGFLKQKKHSVRERVKVFPPEGDAVTIRYEIAGSRVPGARKAIRDARNQAREAIEDYMGTRSKSIER